MISPVEAKWSCTVCRFRCTSVKDALEHVVEKSNNPKVRWCHKMSHQLTLDMDIVLGGRTLSYKTSFESISIDYADIAHSKGLVDEILECVAVEKLISDRS